MSSSDVEALRVRARRRLIGMVVLVGAGVIGFPWLFETKPRPMAGDIQIVQAPQAGASAAASGHGPTGDATAGTAAVAGATIAAVTAPRDTAAPVRAATEAPVATKAETKAADNAGEEREEFIADAPAKPVASKPAVAKPVQPKAPEKSADKPAEKAADKATDKAKDKSSARYVVQFGAFAEASAAHEARLKAERLGLKTYAQQVDTPQGKRIRVRLGPFADKAEADKAAASLRKAGLPGAVLTL